MYGALLCPALGTGHCRALVRKHGLEDILGIPPAKINDDRFYRGLDVLAAHKDKLCAHLMDRYRDWFGIRFEFLLYDVTSTFFEGKAEANEKAARGYSRDRRSDCQQVCIGLVCTPEGLPLAFEVFAGNRTDVTTVEEIVRIMEEKYGQADRVWVMDRGMVSEKHIAFLRERGARYLVGTPKSQLREFEAQLLEKEGWSEVQSGLEARLIDHSDGKGQKAIEGQAIWAHSRRLPLCDSGSAGSRYAAPHGRSHPSATRQALQGQLLRPRKRGGLPPMAAASLPRHWC